MDRSTAPLRRPAWVALVLVAAAVAACGAAGSASQAGAPDAGTPDGDRIGQQGAGQPAASAGNGGTGGNGGGGSAGNGAFRDLARIVYTGSLALKVDDLDAAVKAGREVVLAAGGYVGASRQTTSDDRRTASITYRIPAPAWEATLESLRDLGSVLSEATDSAEVTGQIVDLRARIRNLRVSEAAIQGIAEKAATFEEILDGQARLSSVRDEIERADAQLASLEEQADLGTLTVTYGTEVVAVATAAEAARWDAGGEVAQATTTLVGMLQALGSFAIWFGIVWLPVIAALLAIAFVVRWLLRRTGLLARLGDPIRPPVPGA